MEDLGGALDISLSRDQEAKFLALKSLYTKKLRSIMTTIDSKEKEITKLQVMNKDNRRTQMIQALKSKIRDSELVVDVLKEVLTTRSDKMTAEEVNNFIIRRTVAGPKRFRPSTREEMELKIAELEKRVLKLTATSGTGPSSSASIAASAKNNKDAKSTASVASNINNNNASASKKVSSSQSVAGSQLSDARYSSARVDEINNFADLSSELNDLKAFIEAKNIVIEKQRNLITDLRARTSALAIVEDQEEIEARNKQEADESASFYLEEIEKLTRRLGEVTEENMNLCMSLTTYREDQNTEIETLHEYSRKLIEQNASLMDNIAALEQEVEEQSGRFSHVPQGGLGRSPLAASESPSGDQTKALQQKITKLQQQLKVSEGMCAELNNELQVLRPLRETMREKNLEIRELRRELDNEKAKVAKLAAVSKESPSISPSLGAIDGPKVAALFEENRQLRQALAAVTLDKPDDKRPSTASSIVKADRKGEFK